MESRLPTCSNTVHTGKQCLVITTVCCWSVLTKIGSRLGFTSNFMVRRKYDIPAIVGLVLVLVSIASFRSEFRLRPEMPVEFLDGKPMAPKERAFEERVARAYWNCAVEQVQWKYGY